MIDFKKAVMLVGFWKDCEQICTKKMVNACPEKVKMLENRATIYELCARQLSGLIIEDIERDKCNETPKT